MEIKLEQVPYCPLYGAKGSSNNNEKVICIAIKT
jgi:hypothetical protein